MPEFKSVDQGWFARNYPAKGVKEERICWLEQFIQLIESDRDEGLSGASFSEIQSDLAMARTMLRDAKAED